jgi:hypothetical protein
MQVNRVDISNVKEYAETASKIGQDESALLLIWRNGRTFYLTVSP